MGINKQMPYHLQTEKSVYQIWSVDISSELKWCDLIQWILLINSILFFLKIIQNMILLYFIRITIIKLNLNLKPIELFHIIDFQFLIILRKYKEKIFFPIKISFVKSSWKTDWLVIVKSHLTNEIESISNKSIDQLRTQI